MFTDMGLTQTFSRPRTPNDNPFIESFFSSTKRTRMYPGWFCSQEEGPVTEYFGWYFPWYNTEHYHSRIGYVTPEQQHQGLASGIIAERKNYWQSSRNFVKCTGSQIKQPETGSSELKPRFATSSKNHAGADIVIGHHTHCINGNEVYNGVPIYYSLGNFLFTMQSSHKDWYTGLVLEVEIQKKGKY